MDGNFSFCERNLNFEIEVICRLYGRRPPAVTRFAHKMAFLVDFQSLCNTTVLHSKSFVKERLVAHDDVSSLNKGLRAAARRD